MICSEESFSFLLEPLAVCLAGWVATGDMFELIVAMVFVVRCG